MIMNKEEAMKSIQELEGAMKKTEETIQRAWLTSVLMVEPIRSKFEAELKLKQKELNESKNRLELYKSMLKD